MTRNKLRWWPVVLLAVAAALPVAFAADEEKKEEPKWLTSLDEARKAAKEKKKVILADFTGSEWCSWCIKLKKDVFDTEEFKAWAADHVVLLELDFPRPEKDTRPAEIKEQNKKLQEKFKVRGYPTLVFMDTEGAELGRISGYKKAADWLKEAKKIVEKSQAAE